jgi:flagellar motor switch protein FliG
MTNVTNKLRKAAVLIRSLDADTAAIMLGQLSAEEATAIRAAMRELGPLNLDEQADVAAEFRRGRTSTSNASASGVELSLSSFGDSAAREAADSLSKSTSAKRFEFLDDAPVKSLAPRLEREHPQTIAVVLAHLSPARAAELLAAPQKVAARNDRTTVGTR